MVTTYTRCFFPHVTTEFNWEFNSPLQWKFPEGRQGENIGGSSSNALFFLINQHVDPVVMLGLEYLWKLDWPPPLQMEWVS